MIPSNMNLKEYRLTSPHVVNILYKHMVLIKYWFSTHTYIYAPPPPPTHTYVYMRMYQHMLGYVESHATMYNTITQYAI